MKNWLALLLLTTATTQAEVRQFQPAGQPQGQILALGLLPPDLPKALAADGLAVSWQQGGDQPTPNGAQILLTSDGSHFDACQSGPYRACIFLNAQFNPQALTKPVLDLVNAPRLPLAEDLGLRQTLLRKPSRFYSLALREATKGEEKELAAIIKAWVVKLNAGS